MGSPALPLNSGFYVTIATPRGSTTKRIDGDVLSVGRAADCNLAIEHESMSRRHLSVSLKRGECWIEDHGSVNGTFINNAKLVPHAPVRVRPEDQVVLAQSGVKLYVSAEAFVRKEGSPPVPKDEVTAVTQAVVTTTIAEKRLQAREAAIPEARPVRDSQQKAETLVIDAYKKSSHLIHEAEIEAERRVEDIYRRAHETQSKIDATYQRRLNEAYRAGEEVFQQSQGQAEEILMSARERANQMRDQAQAFISELRSQTERDCERLLDDAQVTARELKTARMAEADELIKQRMNEQLERRKQEIDQELQAAFAKIEQLKLDTKDLEQQKKHSLLLRAEIEKSQVSVGEFNNQLSVLRTEVDQLEKARSGTREQLKLLQEQLRAADSKVKTVQHDTQTQMLNLRAQFEEDKAKWMREEHQKIEEMKLEATRKARKLEKELLEELEAKKERIGREVTLLVETELKGTEKGEPPDLKHMQNAINKKLKETLVGMAKDSVAYSRQQSLIALRRREKVFSYFAGALLGAAALIGAERFSHLKFDVSPVQNKIMSAIEQRKLDLEKRRFSPQQTPEYRMNYVDNVIYGENFIDNYLSDDFQDALLAEVMPYLLRTWRIQEDKAIQLLAMNSALVKSLAEKRDKIHPDFVTSSIEKMRAFEKENQTKIVELLGSQVRVEAYKKFEAQFYARYTQPQD